MHRTNGSLRDLLCSDPAGRKPDLIHLALGTRRGLARQGLQLLARG